MSDNIDHTGEVDYRAPSSPTTLTGVPFAALISDKRTSPSKGRTSLCRPVHEKSRIGSIRQESFGVKILQEMLIMRTRPLLTSSDSV